jgi:signal peptidase I
VDQQQTDGGGGAGVTPEPERAPAAGAGPEAARGGAEAGAGPDAAPRWRRGTVGCLVELLQTLVLTLVIFFVIQAFVAQPFKVELFSMQQTFEPGDYVLIDKLSPRWDTYTRGDVVVFEPPESWTTEKIPYIKRVIGEPGDTVEVRDDGLVWVNGVVLDEPYLFRDDAGDPEPTYAEAGASWVVPEGQLFVMGDHRTRSADSRAFGTIPVTKVLGRGVVRYWPLASFWFVATPTYAGVPAP